MFTSKQSVTGEEMCTYSEKFIPLVLQITSENNNVLKGHV